MTLQNKITQLLQDPENRDIVNEGQDEFTVVYYKGRLSFSFDYELLGYDESSCIIFDDIPKTIQLSIIRHCINLLPAFDVRIVALYEECDEGAMSFYWSNTAIEQEGELGYRRALTPQTIRQALLQCGVMTLEELEQYAQDNNLIDTV